ncbi:Ig-like domain-containing protein [Rummeliibacillus suwonensis]|uniref:Ig-like domain-containing protein n=1 Tax=Rummeliibacillus suwonensis TaxID=1306154 RepID=UPI002898EFBE|nr:Ig-like domain-containing protein [Rummeliibacillus suwonensis]
MSTNMKRLFHCFAFVICFIFLSTPIKANAQAFDPNEDFKDLGIRFYNDEKPDIGFYMNASSRYILETVKEPKMGSVYGEWSVMDLLRGMYTGYDYINYIPSDYFTAYKKGINQYVMDKGGILDPSKSTEWSRLTLAMTALGQPITDIAGYNFVDKLSQSLKFSYRQGINGPIWELIALATGGYDLYTKPSKFEDESDINSKGKMIDYIMKKEIPSGGWALWGSTPDPDITGMALQAFAPYYLSESKYNATDATASYTDFKKSVERAIVVLGNIQADNGAYNAWGNVNVESTVQVIVALTALNINPKTTEIYLPTIQQTAKFNEKGATQDGVYTDNMIDALYTFWAWGSGSSPEVGGFKHVTTGYDGGGGSGTGVNAMATDQALYGLIAYDRYAKGKNTLYDMSDMKNGEYKTMTAKKYTVTFKMGNETVTESYSPYALVSMKDTFGTNHTPVIAWATKEDGQNAAQYLTSEKLSMPEQNITLYAKTNTKSYKISYQLNGGILDDRAASTYIDVEGATLPTAIQVKKAGYQFVGWYTNANFSGAAVTSVPKNSSGDQIFYAKWVDMNSASSELVQMIKNLPLKITSKDIISIQNARTLYESLSVDQKLLVTNIGKLLDAEQQVLQLNQNNNGTTGNTAESVTYLIEQLPAISVITLDAQSAITKARTAYDSLIISEKRLVSNYSLLVRAEKAFDTLVSKEVDQKVADRLIKQINALPTTSKVTLKDLEKIQVARTAYDVVTLKQQEMVTNYNKLIQLELRLKSLEADKKLSVQAVTNARKTITGTATPNITVKVYNGSKKIATGKAKANGKFSLTIKQQKAGSKLKISTSDGGIKYVTVKASKTLKKPIVSSAKTTKITGKSKKGYTVEVYKGSKRIGTAKVSKKGTFTVKIIKQKKNTKLKIQVKDSLNNHSEFKMVKVQ